jgi:hypothetical protein
MHFITVKKSDNVIIDYRVDASKPACWNVETLCAAVANDQGFLTAEIETFSFDSAPQSELGNFNGPLTPYQHCLETMTGIVKNNPAYIPSPVVRYWRIGDIRSHLNLTERVKWDNDKTDTIKTAKIELAPGLLEPEATEVLQLLVDAGDISAASLQKILA